MLGVFKKAALGVLFLCFLSSFIYHKDKPTVKWMEWDAGYILAKKENKMILVDAYTDWCGWCKKMDKDTYRNEEIIALLNKNFVAIKFNPEIEDVVYDLEGKKFNGKELLMQLSQGKSTGFPSTYFIEPNKRQIQVAAGYLNPSDFKKVLEQVLATQ